MSKARTGSTLIEALVALPILALIGLVAISLLISVHRRAIRDDGLLGATRELRHGAGILSADFRGVRSTDVITWSDSTIEVVATVGVGVVCASDSSQATVDLVGSSLSGVALSYDVNVGEPLAEVWNQSPQIGDGVEIWTAGGGVLDSLVGLSSTVMAIGTPAACAQSPIQSAAVATSTRLTLAAPPARRVVTGTSVRVTRRTRYAAYRAADGDYYLGRRTLGPSGWDVIQPVAGPLVTNAQRGLVIAAFDSTGALLNAPAPSRPARLEFSLRAPRRAGRAASINALVDSLRVDVALRADRSNP